MRTDETRPEAICAEELVVSATEQIAPEQSNRVITSCKRIVPSLSTLAVMFLASDWGAIMNGMGTGNHGHGH